jgi:hypothetical protein
MSLINSKLVIACILFFVANTAQAEFWSSNTKVTKVYPYNDGLILFTLYSNADVSTCAPIINRFIVTQ